MRLPSSSTIVLFALTAVFSVTTAVMSSATEMTWTGKVNDVWKDNDGPANWTGGSGVIQSGDTAIFNIDADCLLSGSVVPNELRIAKGSVVFDGDGSILSNSTIVSDGASLGFFASENVTSAVLQGGELHLEKGSNLTIYDSSDEDYSMNVGNVSPRYVATALSKFAKDEKATVTLVGNGNNLFAPTSYLFDQSNGRLYVEVERLSAQSVYESLSDSVASTIDIYRGDSDFLEEMLYDSDTEAAGKGIQSGFDMVNLSGAASAIYETKQAINDLLSHRLIDGHVLPRSGAPLYGLRGQCTQQRTLRFAPNALTTAIASPTAACEVWAAPFYQNTKGFGLYSGDYRYGYKNDLGGIAAGLDRTDGALRYGIMGVGGGRIRSNGDVADTRNDTGFGGVYGYLNERFHGANFFVHGGWMGMQNKIAQDVPNDAGTLSGKLNNGLVSVAGTLSQMFCFDGLHLTATLGVEYGYYYQNSMKVNWSDADSTAFNVAKGKANLWTLPVGVRLSREFDVNGCVFTPELHAKYIWNFGNTIAGYDVLIGDGGLPAPMIGYIVDRNNYDVGVGLGWMKDHWSLRGDYSFLWSTHRQSNLVSITGAYKF